MTPTKTTASASEAEWTYSTYRAMLRRHGKNFAIVSPDHVNALGIGDAETLLGLLNRPTHDERVRALVEAVKTAIRHCGEDYDERDPFSDIHRILTAALLPFTSPEQSTAGDEP